MTRVWKLRLIGFIIGAVVTVAAQGQEVPAEDGKEYLVRGGQRPVVPAGSVSGGARRANEGRSQALQADAYAVLGQNESPGLYTVDAAACSYGAPTATAGKMYFARVKGLDADTVVSKVIAFAGVKTTTDARIGVAVYRMDALSATRFKLTYLAGGWEPLDFETQTGIAIQFSSPLVLERDRAYFIGYVYDSVTGIDEATYKEIPTSTVLSARETVTEDGGFPSELIYPTGDLSVGQTFVLHAVTVPVPGLTYQPY